MGSHLIATVPAQKEYVHVLRAVVGSASSLLDATVETIQDLRLIVDEACGRLLALRGEPGLLSMRIDFDPDRMNITITVDGTGSDWSEIGPSPLADRILAALTDGYRLEQAPAPAVVMTKLLRVTEG